MLQAVTSRQPCHDFMLERKWLFVVMGFGRSKSFLYILYVACIYGYFFCQVGLIVYGMVLASGKSTLVLLDALHVLVLLEFALWGRTTRFMTDRSLEKLRTYIKSGFYLYEEECLLDEQLRIKERTVEEIKTKSKGFVAFWITNGFIICFFFPMSQYFYVTKEDYENVVDVANPYLPSFLYVPFKTREPVGFVAAYFLAVLMYFYIIGAGMIMNEIYISCILQLRVQLQILNNSIRHIPMRAMHLYLRLMNTDRKPKAREVCRDSNYQKCLYKCLMSNVKHHQILLRFNEEFMKYGGSLLLLMFNVASIVFASNLYLVIQSPYLNISIKCLMTLIGEQLYVLYMCVFGEIIMEESANLFESLYSIPWFYYNKAFNQTLRVFMCYTMKPMRVKALLLDMNASHETYGNFMSAMYKILNLLKQSDTI